MRILKTRKRKRTTTIIGPIIYHYNYSILLTPNKKEMRILKIGKRKKTTGDINFFLKNDLKEDK